MTSPIFSEIVQELNTARSRCSECRLEISDQELDWLIEDATGLTKLQRLLQEAGEPKSAWKEKFSHYLQRRLRGEPTQYILGRAGFYGREFNVNPAVLIPRPETELLIEWVIGKAKRMTAPRILDVGTGSGCIAISLALEIPGSQVTALDISVAALAVAQDNAREMGANVVFVQHDFLNEVPPGGPFDIVVSNPPYVPVSERATMQVEVAEYEPHIALFAGDDHQSFFKRMSVVAPKIVDERGWVLMEGHAHHLQETRILFHQPPFTEVNIHSDLAGLDRFLTARVDPS